MIRDFKIKDNKFIIFSIPKGTSDIHVRNFSDNNGLELGESPRYHANVLGRYPNKSYGKDSYSMLCHTIDRGYYKDDIPTKVELIGVYPNLSNEQISKFIKPVNNKSTICEIELEFSHLYPMDRFTPEKKKFYTFKPSEAIERIMGYMNLYTKNPLGKDKPHKTGIFLNPSYWNYHSRLEEWERKNKGRLVKNG